MERRAILLKKKVILVSLQSGVEDKEYLNVISYEIPKGIDSFQQILFFICQVLILLKMIAW